MSPSRPLLRYHGGKWRLAPWITSFFPPHRVYVEPFGGGAAVLLSKPRSYAEVYNDLDEEVVNLFRVARDEGEELARRVRLTPYSRREFFDSFIPTTDPIEQARRTLVRSHMGFGGNLTQPNRDQSPQRIGFRRYGNSGESPSCKWRNLPESIPVILERLRGVIIDCRPATEIMAAHDAPDALHYVDPPYVHSTRSVDHRGYRYEMTDDDHLELAAFLRTLRGYVVVSGYRCRLYDRAFRRWSRHERRAMADGARARVETLWINRPHYGQLRLVA